MDKWGIAYFVLITIVINWQLGELLKCMKEIRDIFREFKLSAWLAKPRDY